MLGKGGALVAAGLPYSHLLYLRGKPHTLLSLDLTVISEFNCTVIPFAITLVGEKLTLLIYLQLYKI